MISDPVIIALIGFATTLWGGYVTLQQAKMAKVVNDIHVLTNSSYGVALESNAKNSRWRANSTKLPADIAAADHAEKVLKEHEKKQAVVDLGKT